MDILDNFKEKCKKEKDAQEAKRQALYTLSYFDLLEKEQEKYGESYKPKWNFGFHRKCPVCGNSLRKYTLYYNQNSRNYIPSIFFCKNCKYECAHSEINHQD